MPILLPVEEPTELRFVDAHTHAYLRSSEDLELMALAGVEGLILCSYYPIRPSGPSTLIDLYRWLMEDEPSRFGKYGMYTKAAVGIHPRSIPLEGVDQVLRHLKLLFESKGAPALGEVGLETGSRDEEKVLESQVRLAGEAGIPVIIHTPRTNKASILDKTLVLLHRESVDLGKVIIDHLTPELAPKVRSLGAVAGLTVQPGKLTPKDVENVISRNGPDGIVVNSDLGNVPSDPLTLPRVARHLETAGFSAKDIEMVTRSNIRHLLAM